MSVNSPETKSSNLISLGHAARIAGVREMTIRRWLESGALGQPHGQRIYIRSTRQAYTIHAQLVYARRRSEPLGSVEAMPSPVATAVGTTSVGAGRQRLRTSPRL